MEKVGVIVEARMTSSRFPGKHLKMVNNDPILALLLKRLRTIKNVDQVILATTTNNSDNVLVEMANNLGIKTYRGDEFDVLKRVVKAAQYYNLDIICEVTGDCPLIDLDLVENLIANRLLNPNIDYLNNGKAGLPDGMGCQVFSTTALVKSEILTSDPFDREHVTTHIKKNPKLFNILYLVPQKKHQLPHLRFTLDYYEDYIFIKKIFEEIHGVINLDKIIELTARDLPWVKAFNDFRKAMDL